MSSGASLSTKASDPEKVDMRMAKVSWNVNAYSSSRARMDIAEMAGGVITCVLNAKVPDHEQVFSMRAQFFGVICVHE